MFVRKVSPRYIGVGRGGTQRCDSAVAKPLVRNFVDAIPRGRRYTCRICTLRSQPRTTIAPRCIVSRFLQKQPDSSLARFRQIVTRIPFYIYSSLSVRMMFRNRKEEKKISTKNLISLRICFASKIRKQLKYKLETSTIENGIEKGKNIKA